MVNTVRIYPLVIVELVVIFLQLSVKYRRPSSVCKAVGIYFKYFFKKLFINSKKTN